MKKLISMFLVLLALICLSGCNGKKLKRIGIIQYVAASALDDARDGIIEGLKEQGFIDKENIQITVYQCLGDASTMKQCIDNALEKSDMIFSIATPCTQALIVEMNKRELNIPVLFTAVTDPVKDNIVSDDIVPNSFVSGTSDMNPVSEQVSLIKELKADATKMGFIYTLGESNSIAQLELAQAECDRLGIELISQGVINQNELKTATESLISKGIDALYLPTDNIVSSNCNIVIRACNLVSVPTICGESGFLDHGGTISYSINYFELGKLTGNMGSDVLKGANIKEMSVKRLTKFTLVINKTTATSSNIEIPTQLLNKADEIK